MKILRPARSPCEENNSGIAAALTVRPLVPDHEDGPSEQQLSKDPAKREPPGD